MLTVVEENQHTAAQVKRIEERRKWAVEQAVKLVPAPEKVVELAKAIENYIIGRWVT